MTFADAPPLSFTRFMSAGVKIQKVVSVECGSVCVWSVCVCCSLTLRMFWVFRM